MDPIAHGYDWAWAQISGQNVKSNGGTFVIRYLGGSAALTPQERDNLHAEGVNILLVFEQEATLAEGGYNRGLRAATDANNQADALGYPSDVPIFYADDNNDPDPSQEVEFIRGVLDVGRREAGMYSGGNVLAAIHAAWPDVYTWRVETWYPNDYPNPDFEQLANTRDPAMVGVSPGDYDTNLQYRSVPMWGPNGTTNGEDDMTPEEVRAVIFDPTVYGLSSFEAAFKGAAEKYVLPKVSAWIGQLQDHIDAALAALPHGADGSVSIDDVKAAIAGAIAHVTLEVK